MKGTRIMPSALRLACWMVLSMFAAVPAHAVELGLPAACSPAHDCFFQQFPDMDRGPDAVDPFCGSATYDGHDGIDLRVLSMADLARGVPVIAMADGLVLRLRDGEPDRLVVSAEDRRHVGSRECGNGVVVDHGEGVEVQYCHLRQGSIAVRKGDRIVRGDRLGLVGASGLAQFPHVHVTVRKDGKAVDPSTGRVVGEGCKESPAGKPLFSDEAMKFIAPQTAPLLAFGLTGAVFDHKQLVLSGPPAPADSSSPAVIGWVWLQSLRAGERISVAVTAPDGHVLATGTTQPLDRPKATYSAYAGRKTAPIPGEYTVAVKLLRGGKVAFEKTGTFHVK